MKVLFYSFFICVVSVNVNAQDVATSELSCAEDLNASSDTTLGALLDCMVEMQNEINRAREQPDLSLYVLKSDLPSELYAPNGEPTKENDELDSFRIIKSKETFTLPVGKSMSIGSSTMIISLDKMDANGTLVTYSNVEKDVKANSLYVQQAKPIKFYEGCSLIPREIISTEDERAVKFYSAC